MNGTLFDDARGMGPEDWTPDQLRPIPDGVEVVGFDTETTGLKWWDGHRPIGYSAAWREGNDIVEVYYPTGHAGGNLDPARVKEWLETELRGKTLVGLNIRFDAHMTREAGVTLDARLEDAAHYVALLDDHRAYGQWSLDAIARDYLGEGKVADGLQMDRMAEYHASKVAAYARQDAGLALRLREKLFPEIVREDLVRVLNLESDVIPVVVAMEARGCPLDMEKLARWERESERKLARLQIELAAEAGFRVDVNKPTSMAKLWDKLGWEVTERTETGLPSFTDDVLKARETEHPAIPLARQVGQLLSLRSKFLSAYKEAAGADGVIRYGLNQLRGDEGGMVSGRFSSSAPVSKRLNDGKASGINVQQVFAVEKQHKRLGPDYTIRELFVPEPGALFMAEDADQIEYRLFAHYANSESILETYRKDPTADFHQVVTDMVNAVVDEPISRHQCKQVNFARLYGAGPTRVAEMLGSTEAEAKAFLKVYDQAFPEVKKLARAATDAAERKGFVRTMLGRRARFPNGERSYKALNSVIQGTAADVMKLKLVALYDVERETGLTLRFTVHDEVCGDVPDAEAARQVHEVLQVQAVDSKVPLLWSGKTGANWAECK